MKQLLVGNDCEEKLLPEPSYTSSDIDGGFKHEGVC
jgi:hypothetical protein